jgi:hypothetical protein
MMRITSSPLMRRTEPSMTQPSLLRCISIVATLVLLGCGGEPPTASVLPPPPPPPPPSPITRAGILRVITTTTGASLDPNGFTLMIDGAGGYALGINDTVTVSHVREGSHAVRVADVAQNCTVTGSNPQTVAIYVFDETTVEFAVTCAAPVPTTGSLEIRVVNTGAARAESAFGVQLHIEPCGFFEICFASLRSVQVSEVLPVTVKGLPPGNYHLTVSVPRNCVAAGVQPAAPTVIVGQTALVTLVTVCR